jgi:glycosyltransferase involved in cell wall biosynthesis
MVRDLGLERAVQFVGYVPEEVLPRMYAAADAFVLPTTELECFGLIAVEALACGRPVLATPVGAIPEILAEVEPHWLAVDESTEAIAQLLIAFLERKLPHHDPAHLRAAVARRYSKREVLNRLIHTTIGDLT